MTWKQILVLLPLMFLGFFYLIFGVFNGCEDKPYKSFESPNGQKVATIYLRDCGATTSWATRIKLSDSNNELFLDFTLRSKPEEAKLLIEWHSDIKLSVSNFKFEELTFFKRTYNPIAKIAYKPLSS